MSVERGHYDARDIYIKYKGHIEEALDRTLATGKEHGFFGYVDGVSTVLEGTPDYFPHSPQPQRKLVLALHTHPKGYPVLPSALDKLVYEVYRRGEGVACIAGFTDEKKILFCTAQRGGVAQNDCIQRAVSDHMGKLEKKSEESRRKIQELKKLPREQFVQEYEKIRAHEKRQRSNLFQEREEKIEECTRKFKITYEHSYHEIKSQKNSNLGSNPSFENAGIWFVPAVLISVFVVLPLGWWAFTTACPPPED